MPRCTPPLKPAIARCTLFGILIIAFTSHTLAQNSDQFSDLIKRYNQAVTSKDYRSAAKYSYDIADHYDLEKNTTRASEYLNQSLAYAKKSSDQSLLYVVYHKLGTINMGIKKYSKALENFQSALDIAKQLKDTILIKEGLINVSISYGYTERYKKSIEYAEEALSMAIVQSDSALQQKCYQLLADYYNKQGNKKRAAEYMAQYDLMIRAREIEVQKTREVDDLKQRIEKAGQEKLVQQSRLSAQEKKLRATNDSLRFMAGSLRATEDSLKEMDEISRHRQLEIDLLQKDKELAEITIRENESRLKNAALVRNFIIVATFLALVLIVVLIISYRKKLKDNQKIDHQNTNIKSSINYAKRIQDAMLPKIDQYRGISENSFILFKPRDTVSGDFYWFADFKYTSDIAFAAVDCTGHGVPGAFMSMIGINALNGLVNQGVTETNVILDSLDREIRTALKQEVSGNNDGMDAALCIYRPEKRILEFSGAKNPLVYIQNNELFQIKGDIHSLGGSRSKNGFAFKKHRVIIDKPTTIYLFSDGYKDQFGGKDNGKFLSKRLNQLLLEIHTLPMEAQMRILETTIEEWKGANAQTDDILVIGLRLIPN
jgi:serine phosphatase RsbU (regulator of sigma subunit)